MHKIRELNKQYQQINKKIVDSCRKEKKKNEKKNKKNVTIYFIRTCLFYKTSLVYTIYMYKHA